mgnify:FL=1
MIEKIRSTFSEAIKKKSLVPLANGINLFFFHLFKHKSLKQAVQEQGLDKLTPKLENVVENHSEQFNHVKIEGEYWNYKVRAHHAFQFELAQKAINIVKEELKKKEITIVDIGDSAGTHVTYLKKLINDTPIKTLSVNLDPEAIKKIKKKGLEAIHARAEDLKKYNVEPDLFLSFQTVEHLNSPVTFLKSITQNTSCNYFLITVPFLSESRVGLEHIRNNIKDSVHAENIHIFELCPEDWKLIFRHTGWQILKENIYRQYPKKHPLRLLKKSWAKYDFEGFYGVILKKDLSWTERYIDW